MGLSNRRLLLIGSLILGLIGTVPTFPAKAEVSNWPTKPSIGFTSSEKLSDGVRNLSWITGYSYAEGTTSGLFTQTADCESVTDAICSKADSIALNAILPPCSASIESNCIDSLVISNEADSTKAVLSSEVVGKKFSADAKFDTPAGANISIWKASGKKNSLQTDEYAVNVHIDLQNFNNKNCESNPSRCPFNLGNFSAAVHPVRMAKLTNQVSCLWKSATECLEIGEYLPATKVNLAIRITNKLTGFMFGRLSNVEIEVTPLSTSQNLVRVSAEPLDVPSLYAFVEKSALTSNPDIENFWKTRRSNMATSDLASDQTIDLGPWPQYAMPDFLAFEKFVKSGPLVKSIWKFGNGLGVGTGSSCFNDKTKLLGLVTTSSSTYSPAPPTFDGTSLNYQVGGAHFLADGTTLNRGSYDLAIRSDFARCLYGFSSAPIQASVSVISVDGSTQNVATEVVRQDKAKEWIYLSAKNFTYSAPTIKVKLTQEPMVTKKVQVKTTISCTNGKIVKKVSGVKPTCPKGFKKK